MPERTIDWGGSDSPYQTRVDRDGDGRVVLAEDTSGNTVLLEYDEAAGEWVYGGPVNMGGSDISNVGEVDATAVSTGNLKGDYPSFVRAISNGSVVATVDPSTTSSPIQDAIDAVNNQGDGRGRIWVPNNIDEAGGLSDFSYIDILGYHEVTIVNHTDDSVPFIDVQGERECSFDNLQITGPGSSGPDATAIRFGKSDNMYRANSFDLGTIRIRGYNSPTAVIDGTYGGPWNSQWDYVRLDDCSGHGMVCEYGGRTTRVGTFETYLNDTYQPLDIRSGSWMFGQVNIGGAAGYSIFRGAETWVGTYNYEPTEGTLPDWVIWDGGSGTSYYWAVREAIQPEGPDGTIDSCIRLGPTPENTIIADIRGTFNNEIIIGDDLQGPCWYFGDNSSIFDTSSGGTGYLRTLASAGTGNG